MPKTRLPRSSRSRRAGALALAACLTAALSACGGAALTRQDFESTTARSFWTYAAAGKPFLLEIHNVPEQVEPEDVARLFPSPGFVAPAGEFTVSPERAAHPAYRFALLFDAPRGVGGDDVCALRGAQADVQPAGTGAVHAAFCHRETAVTDVRAENGVALFTGGAGTAEMRNFLYRLGTALLPPEDRDRDRCGPLRRPCIGAGVF